MKFQVDACPPRAPQAKGKIERRVGDHRGALDPSGLVFRDLAELQARTYAEVAARGRTRRCAETGASGAEVWAVERGLPTPLPETAPEPFDVVVARVVGRDGLVSFERRRYSVPFRHVGDTVEVRGVAGAVLALKDCAVIARHPRGTDRRLVIDQAHYDGPSNDRSSLHRRWDGWERASRRWPRRRGAALDRPLRRARAGRAMMAAKGPSSRFRPVAGGSAIGGQAPRRSPFRAVRSSASPGKGHSG